VIRREVARKQWREYILSCIWGPLLVAQFVFVFTLGRVNEAGLDVLMYIGWLTWGLSIVFGWWPILILKRKGGVARGESFVKTTVLVDNGLYSIVRHPQYTAGLLFSLALILISQSWLVTGMGVVAISLLYIDIIKADGHEVEKFGETYKRYMKDVPRTNFILGLLRQIRRRYGK
jgi:protein-S-isoprenylcysteine O-methyltransferase Ste14